jgi:hypothetical protein
VTYPTIFKSFLRQVIKNIVHVTVSGVFASSYFLSGSGEMPNTPTLGAAKRAMTTSLGSICYGSLLVALIQFVRAMVAELKKSDNAGAAILGVCIDCCLACIEDLVEYFNHYAYTQVAIYGKDFCTAAKV